MTLDSALIFPTVLIRQDSYAIYFVFHRSCKNGNFQMKHYDILHIFAQNIDRGYTLELPHKDDSDENP